MKCFIASAFGHNDVDMVYDRYIVPTLKKLSVTPLRVDRVEHNEDIDNKIFELLDSADFAIADLTYARPSVYYEAGYATGKSKPVIYIAKSDHFKARNDDSYGNFRVHFDLQMRNIIPWNDSDRTFSDKLLKRIQLVLRPLERANRNNLKLVTERSEFNHMPMLSRLELLQRTGVEILKRRSFQEYQNFQSNPEATNGNAFTLWRFLRRMEKKRFQGVGIITTSSASKQLFQYFSYRPLFFQSPDYPDPKFRETHYIVVSLNSVPRSRIAEGLPFFHPLNNTTLTSESKKSRAADASITYVHVLDGIKSRSEFGVSFRAVLDEYVLTKGA